MPPASFATSSSAAESFGGVERNDFIRTRNASLGNCVSIAVSICWGRFPVESERMYSVRGPTSFLVGVAAVTRPARALGFADFGRANRGARLDTLFVVFFPFLDFARAIQGIMASVSRHATDRSNTSWDMSAYHR